MPDATAAGTAVDAQLQIRHGRVHEVPVERDRLLAGASLPEAEVRRVQTWWATARRSMAGEAVGAVHDRGESGERERVCWETGRAVSCL